MRRHTWTAALCGLFTTWLAMGQPSSASAQPARAAPAAAPAPKAQNSGFPAVESWKLDNGLTVAFLHVPSAPVVAVEVWYHVGSRDEPRDRRGVAHMFEHLMGEGSQLVPPGEHARQIERLGGYSRATTGEDAISFTNVLPSEYVDFACRLEAERMRNLLLRAEPIAAARALVDREIRESSANPFVRGLWRFLEIAYTRHPYAWTASGVRGDLAAITPDDLKRFYDTYYVPQNALLIVAGNVTKEQVEKSARAWFGAIPGGSPPPRPAEASAEPAQTDKRREVIEPNRVGLVISGFHIPEARNPDIYPLQVASLILGGGDFARLQRRLVAGEKIAVQAGSTMLVREEPGLFTLFGAHVDPAAGDKVEAEIAEEVKKLAATPVTPRELGRAKNQLTASLVGSLAGVAGKAEQTGIAWIQTGDPAAWQAHLAGYQAVTAADIQRVARKYFVDSNLTVVVIPLRGDQ